MHHELMKVLLIEDDAADAKLLGEMLSHDSNQEFQVIHASEHLTASQRMAMGGMDALLLKLPLPGSQGLSSFDKLLPHAHGIPVIVVTAPEDEALGRWAVLRGAQDYLLKWQFDTRWLKRSISMAVCRKRLEAATEGSHAKALPRDAYLAGASNRLLEPISLVLGMTELLLDTGLTLTQETYLGILKGSGMALHSVAEEIRDYCAGTSGTTTDGAARESRPAAALAPAAQAAMAEESDAVIVESNHGTGQALRTRPQRRRTPREIAPATPRAGHSKTADLQLAGSAAS
ncbi:MAG TPA: response regulator [Planctomycetota bacterium]|nr:response regulator [Planctomycetota bacterium]